MAKRKTKQKQNRTQVHKVVRKMEWSPEIRNEHLKCTRKLTLPYSDFWLQTAFIRWRSVRLFQVVFGLLTQPKVWSFRVTAGALRPWLCEVLESFCREEKMWVAWSLGTSFYLDLGQSQVSNFLKSIQVLCIEKSLFKRGTEKHFLRSAR